MDPWDRTENMYVNPDLLQPTKHKETAKNIQWRKENQIEQTEEMTDRKNDRSVYTKVKSKWAKDLNVRPEAIKLK